MKQLRFLNKRADFVIEDASSVRDIYFPLVNEAGMMSSITAELAGDCKTGQDTWLLAPASSETLHESRATRNFWLSFADGTLWSASGGSAEQQAKRYSADKDSVKLYGGLLWQKVVRENKKLGVKAEVLSFVPSGKQYHDTVELMQITIENCADDELCFTPTAAIPLYGRSAADIRDHRHVTSLLHRLTVDTYGVSLRPTLTFDERGHQKGKNCYQVYGCGQDGESPSRFLGPVQDFVGYSGSYDMPEALAVGCDRWLAPGDTEEGYEMVGALQFAQRTLRPGERAVYYIVMGIDAPCNHYVGTDAASAFAEAFEQTCEYWQSVSAADFETGNDELDGWLRWVAVQPQLRRIYGCSFLPHHDYGRGGRGWRDLWQDCLSLLLRDPGQIRNDLKNYFAGVRADGTNATIIGKDGNSFVADRNSIVRVWMDHGFWPLRTVELYIQQSGDAQFLLEQAPWFCDNRKHRGEVIDNSNVPESNRLEYQGEIIYSSVLEHLLVQNISAFCDPGAHGNIRLRGADWNDALDQAVQNGESVAFTAAYAGNLTMLADLCMSLVNKGYANLPVSSSLAKLIAISDFSDAEGRKAARIRFEKTCETEYHVRTEISLLDLANKLKTMSDTLIGQLRQNEYLDCGWFNSYYDNDGKPTDGIYNGQSNMMLTGQVFSILSGTADEKMTSSIAKQADTLLYHPERGGYCLNTDFGSNIPPLGRMFGFAYGHKENGAVFCHMSVMYAYALYSRRHSAEGWKVLRELYHQSTDFDVSRIYPGIPEYFDIRGKGMYPYLTGAGSWLVLTMLTQCFGIRGDMGDVVFAPQLTAEQFDADGYAGVTCYLYNRRWQIRFHNPGHAEVEEYRIKSVTIDGKETLINSETAKIDRSILENAAAAVAEITLI